MNHAYPLLAAAATAFLAGAINAVSGGGTLITFPVLIFIGLLSKTANATSTVALWPGVIGSMWGYRQELKGNGAWIGWIGLPAVVGGLTGAFLLLKTPARMFDRLVPLLILGATILFMSSEVVGRWVRARSGSDANEYQKPGWTAVAAIVSGQLLIALYGGYFGAGIGILMLALLGIVGLRDIHRMNGLKAWGAFCTNGVAVVLFVMNGLVRWDFAIAMGIAAVYGGYVGARVARSVTQQTVRRVIVGVGLAATAWLAFDTYFWHGPL